MIGRKRAHARKTRAHPNVGSAFANSIFVKSTQPIINKKCFKSGMFRSTLRHTQPNCKVEFAK